MDSPGYLSEVLFKDAGRLFRVIENHKESITFYLSNFVFKRFSFWFTLFSVGIILIFVQKAEFKKLLSFLFALIACYFIVISASITKLEWYDMPLYPYMAIIAGYGIYWIMQQIGQISLKQSLLFMLLLFSYPYLALFDKSQANMMPEGEKKLEAIEIYLYKRIKEEKNLQGIKIYYANYNGSLLFYKYKLKEKGQNIYLLTEPNFETNDRVLVSNDSLKLVINSKYQTEVVDSNDFAQLLRIKGNL